MKQFTQEEFQKYFEINISDGLLSETSDYGLATLIRNIIMVNPLSTRGEINQRILSMLSPFNVVENDVKKQVSRSIESLKTLKEIVELYRNVQQPVWAAIQPQWIRIDSCNAVLLGDFSEEKLIYHPLDNFDVVRRFEINEENLNIVSNIQETEIYDWLVASCNGQICEDVEIVCFSDLQSKLQKLLREKKELLLLQSSEFLNDDIAVLVGNPAEFWGSYKDLTGRWRKISQVQDGIYFGVIVGERANATRWVLIEKRSSAMRMLQLYDKEQWRWLLLENAAEIEKREIYSFNNSFIRFNVPLPIKLENWLRLFASKQPQWGQWRYCNNEFIKLERILDSCRLKNLNLPY
ncbi:MAG: hypothetical protein LBT05_12880 [Planctomycetaceae bacterium]|jgi:hypothetical protein|nr:hypothetical protein [Planctomycetaceae bacterium]